ncbi:MAG: hypothetical protein JSR54_05615 [Proteobacteria bacterium]|nr:hypothetical protein [Pseudomonadota bacterium]
MTTPTPMAPDARDAPPPPAPAGDPERRARVTREARLFAIVGGFGILLLPPLVYLAGSLTLGPYEGGLPAFLIKLYGDVLHLSPAALALLLGPYVIFQAARLLTRPLRRRRGRAKPEPRVIP